MKTYFFESMFCIATFTELGSQMNQSESTLMFRFLFVRQAPL